MDTTVISGMSKVTLVLPVLPQPTEGNMCVLETTPCLAIGASPLVMGEKSISGRMGFSY
jgi:hypothetical protein